MAADVSGGVTVEYLKSFGDAWNRHDIEDLMTFMTDDCMFQLSVGSEIDGTRYVGIAQVREAYESVLASFPDGNWGDDTHFVAGDRGVSEWTFTATGPNGQPIEVRGCDILTFKDGKIYVKNSFRKNRTA